jgi:hypothetical protein
VQLAGVRHDQVCISSLQQQLAVSPLGAVALGFELPQATTPRRNEIDSEMAATVRESFMVIFNSFAL